MVDESWISKMKICGQSERIWEAFHGGAGDEVRVCFDSSDYLTCLVQIMDVVCLLFLAMIVLSGSGLDQVLQGHAQECVALVFGLFKVRNGALDGRPGGKITTAVSWNKALRRAIQLISHLYRLKSCAAFAADLTVIAVYLP